MISASADQVSPLELFFDLVFVFAVSQLSEHLADHPGWVGAAQTAVLLCAVFGVWTFSSFGVALAGSGRDATASIFTVLFLSLFINSAIPYAFTGAVALFVGPYLVCRLGQVATATLTAASGPLRLHHRSVLVWVFGESVLWALGAFADPTSRLVWWSAAALVNVGGAWTGYPLPRARFDSRAVSMRPGRIVERTRLLLLIALGETVLSIGESVTTSRLTVPVGGAALLALATTSLLWGMYFRASDPIVDARAESSTDPFRVARIAVNSQLVVLAGLIALAVGNGLVISHPLRVGGITESLTVHGGITLYLLAQTWYLRVLTGRWSGARLLGLVGLILTAPLAAVSPAVVGLAVAAALIGAVLAVESDSFRGTMVRTVLDLPRRSGRLRRRSPSGRDAVRGTGGADETE